MDGTPRWDVKTRTGGHQMDRAPQVSTSIHELQTGWHRGPSTPSGGVWAPGGPPRLQNECAGEELAGGFDSRPPPLRRDPWIEIGYALLPPGEERHVHHDSGLLDSELPCR